MPECPKCRIEKDASEFYKPKSDGWHKQMCKVCARAYAKERSAAVRAGTWRRTTRRNVKEPEVSPTLLEIAWAAGFIEGEGSIHCAEPSGRVYATQKDPESLYRLQRLFGGSVVKRTRSATVFGDGVIYDWTLFGPRAFGLMQTIYPFMSQRRRARIRDIVLKATA